MAKLAGNNAPTKDTVGAKGDIYTNTTTGQEFECVGIIKVDVYGEANDYIEYEWKLIEKEESGGSGGSGGGVSSWNDIPDKPFGEEVTKTNVLTWDGDVTGREFGHGNDVKISDYTDFDMADFIGAKIVLNAIDMSQVPSDVELPIIFEVTSDAIQDLSPQGIDGFMVMFMGELPVVTVFKEDVSEAGKGVWFMYYEYGNTFTESIETTKPIFPTTTIKPLDIKFLPEHLQFGDWVEPLTYTFDGVFDTLSKVSTGNFYVKISDNLPELPIETTETYAEYSDGTTSTLALTSYNTGDYYKNNDVMIVFNEFTYNYSTIKAGVYVRYKAKYQYNPPTAWVTSVRASDDSKPLLAMKSHPIDEAYIPENLARKDDVAWSNLPDKPFDLKIGECVKNNSQHTFSANSSVLFSVTTELVANNYYLIVWNGQNYICKAQETVINGVTSLVLGNVEEYGLPHNNEPFKFVSYTSYKMFEAFFVPINTLDEVLYFGMYSVDITRIPEHFIPESVATKEWVEALILKLIKVEETT